jgi:endonuclease/exonuclease/phosphatase family metal-dependent hydrolase
MRILSLNIWGAPWAKHRPERIAAIAEEVKRLNPDVLCFQEVYLESDKANLIGRLRETWPHFHYFSSGLIGSGLLTMSRYPIIEAAFYRFRMSGKPERLNHGDYYVGKGIGLARVAFEDKMLDVYNIHPHAQYEMDNDNEYAVYTESSLYEAVRFVNTHSVDKPLVFCGDFNTRPEQLGYRILMSLGNFLDAYKAYHGKHDITFAADNPYTNEPDQVLDYMLLRGVGIKQISLVCTEKLNTGSLAYSDHYGLLAELDFEQKPAIQWQDARPVLQALYQRIRLALAETEGQQGDGITNALLGIGMIFDAGSVIGVAGRLNKGLAALLRRMLWFGVLGFSAYQLIHAGVNLQARKQTLAALEQEVKKELDELPS